MKHLNKPFIRILGINLLIFSFGCNPGGVTKPISATPEEKQTTAIVDSSSFIKLPDHDSTKVKENIVFDDIRFGISRQDYDTKINTTTQQIGLYKYILIPRFNVLNQLYELLIKSETADDWDTTLNKLQNLDDKIFYTYPTCNYFNNQFSYMNTSPETIEVSREWNIGCKTIITGVIEKQNATSLYFALCRITNIILKGNLGHENDKKIDSVSRQSPGKF